MTERTLHRLQAGWIGLFLGMIFWTLAGLATGRSCFIRNAIFWLIVCCLTYRRIWRSEATPPPTDH